MSTTGPSCVSMREFLRTGNFGDIKLGDSMDQLRYVFGTPHQIGGAKAGRRNPRIWKYGDVEFHLSKDHQRIWLIFCDTFKNLNIGPGTSIDRWFFEGHPSCEIVERNLASAGITCVRRDMPQESDAYLLRLNSGIELLFSYGEDQMMHPGIPGLFGFQYANEQLG